ncbi:MAG: hypothetical protein ACXAB5_07330 [Candidatus Thorarchaeota archaeon]
MTAAKVGLSTDSMEDVENYFAGYFTRRLNRKDIFSTEQVASDFMQRHPFKESDASVKHKIGIRAKLKVGFQLHIIRVNWIQAITGLMQDTLVFAAIYALVLFPMLTDPTQIMLIQIFIVAIPLFFVLTVLGWYYDKRLKVWSADTAVKVERNPFAYIPSPREHIIDLPFFVVLFKTLKLMFNEIGLDTTNLEKQIKYLEEYILLDIVRDEDMKKAREMRSEFGNPFPQTPKEERA